jgi:hypothetical protein
MSTNSEVGKLISANSHLSKLEDPFRSYYAYYMLAEKLQIKLEEFFDSNHHRFAEEIAKQLPIDASAYICHKSEYVKNESTINLKILMLGFLGTKVSKSKLEDVQRPEFEGLDWEILDIHRKKLDEGWATNEKAERDRRIVDFWRRARNCNLDLGQSPQEGHTNLGLMDLIAACSKYQGFMDFLQKEFGNEYEPDKDNLLQELRTFRTKSADPESHKLETKQPLRRRFSSYFKRVILIIYPKQQKKKKGSKEIKGQEKKTGLIGFVTKENMGKLIRFVPMLLLILFGCLGAFMLIGRAKETQVNVTLTTRYLHFQTYEATTLRSPDRLMLGSRHLFSIRNAVYTLDYPFSDTLPAPMKIKPVLHELVGIEYIKLPDDTKVTIATPTQKDIYIGFYESEGLNGFIPMDHSIVFSPEGRDSVIYGQNPIGTGINFHSNKEERSDVSLIDADDFEWPPFYVKSISFGELMRDRVEYGIESAQINFLKSGKSIQLNPKDLLSLESENPLKIQIKYNDGSISLQFTSMVNSIYAGPEILGRSNYNNQMPRLWEDHKELLGILVIVFVLVFPVIMMYKSRARQSK